MVFRTQRVIALLDLGQGRIVADPEDLERIVPLIDIGLIGDRADRKTGGFSHDKNFPLHRLKWQENALVIHHVGQPPLWLGKHLANHVFSVVELNFDGNLVLGDLVGGFEHCSYHYPWNAGTAFRDAAKR